MPPVLRMFGSQRSSLKASPFNSLGRYLSTLCWSMVVITVGLVSDINGFVVMLSYQLPYDEACA